MAGRHRVICGDAGIVLPRLEEASVDMVLTSPPYFRQRPTVLDDEIGSEATVEDYVSRLVPRLHAASRALKPQGTLWLNLGDTRRGGALCAVPQQVLSELMRFGWTFIAEIVWAKSNSRPENLPHRFARAHEMIYVLGRQSEVQLDTDAIRTPHAPATVRKELAYVTSFDHQRGFSRHRPSKTARFRFMHPGGAQPISVWEFPVASERTESPHFSMMPLRLAERCVIAGCPRGGTVLDPFSGSGTSGIAALRNGRRFVGIEILAHNVKISRAALDEAEWERFMAETSVEGI
jgi:DNA modification methylase